MKNTEKKFTWADLKKAVNKIPEKHLQKQVIIWTEDESAYLVTSVDILNERHVYDGDEGCAPISIMKESIAEAKSAGLDNEYYTIHERGTRILYAE